MCVRFLGCIVKLWTPANRTKIYAGVCSYSFTHLESGGVRRCTTNPQWDIYTPGSTHTHTHTRTLLCHISPRWADMKIPQWDKVAGVLLQGDIAAHGVSVHMRECVHVCVHVHLCFFAHTFHTCQHTKATWEAIESCSSCGICYSNGVWLFVCLYQRDNMRLRVLSSLLVGINGADASLWGASRKSLTSLLLL